MSTTRRRRWRGAGLQPVGLVPAVDDVGRVLEPGQAAHQPRAPSSASTWAIIASIEAAIASREVRAFDHPQRPRPRAVEAHDRHVALPARGPVAEAVLDALEPEPLGHQVGDLAARSGSPRWPRSAPAPAGPSSGKSPTSASTTSSTWTYDLLWLPSPRIASSAGSSRRRRMKS